MPFAIYKANYWKYCLFFFLFFLIKDYNVFSKDGKRISVRILQSHVFDKNGHRNILKQTCTWVHDTLFIKK